MLTVFTVPKPFRGHIAVIQRNALRSWAALEPRCEVVVCGEEEGAREAAAETGAAFLPDIARNDFGTPLLSDVFARVEAAARRPLLCYVNADILLLADFVAAAGRLAALRRRFVMVGRRWDLDAREPLALDTEDARAALRRRARAEGTLHPPGGSDYFLYPRGTIGTLPPFAVGRPGWDNWFIWRARALRVPVVDATDVTTVIHQNHDYAHVRQATGAAWEGPEADRNLALMGGSDRVFTLLDATHRLTQGRLERALDPACLRRRLAAVPALHPGMRPLFDAARAVRNALRGA